MISCGSAALSADPERNVAISRINVFARAMNSAAGAPLSETSATTK